MCIHTGVATKDTNMPVIATLQIVTVLLSSAQNGIQALGEVHMRTTLSRRSLPEVAETNKETNKEIIIALLSFIFMSSRKG